MAKKDWSKAKAKKLRHCRSCIANVHGIVIGTALQKDRFGDYLMFSSSKDANEALRKLKSGTY